jgi:hypothetical protein
MTDHSPENPSLGRIVRAGLSEGANSDRIIRTAERLTDRRGWSDAERRRFREQVATLIVRLRARR